MKKKEALERVDKMILSVRSHYKYYINDEDIEAWEVVSDMAKTQHVQREPCDMDVAELVTALRLGIWRKTLGSM